jgi:hypothetical protein
MRTTVPTTPSPLAERERGARSATALTLGSFEPARLALAFAALVTATVCFAAVGAPLWLSVAIGVLAGVRTSMLGRGRSG